MRWVLVAFNHPNEIKSVLYRQNLDGTKELQGAISYAIEMGANLISIRGFPDEEA